MNPNYISLRAWAVSHLSVNLMQARWVIEALDELESLRALNVELTERVAAQSELLSKRAEKRIQAAKKPSKLPFPIPPALPRRTK